MLSFQCQFIVNKFLGSGLFLLFGFLDLWGDPRPGWLDWIGIAAVCTAILLFLWMIVLEKKRGVEKKMKWRYTASATPNRIYMTGPALPCFS